MKEIITGAAFAEMLLCASDALEQNKQLINELNVFPVPDGDTGTNMSLTMRAAATELRKKAPKTATAVADTAASALLRGARGNSGVILSLLFRGMSKGLKGKESFGAKDFAASMTAGVEAAYKAVMKPAEGTVLTVSRLAAAAAEDFCKAGTDVELLLVCALEAAKEALANTVEQNPVLKRAGVVDAGGKGYVIILEAMLDSLQGRAVSCAEPALPAGNEKADFSAFSTEEITFGYCTEFIVQKENAKSVALLRACLEAIGDCVVVVDDDEIIKVHVHTDEPGKALTEALTYGSLLTVKVENMREQHTALEGIQEAENAAPEKPFGVVSVCAGAGMEALFRELGVDSIVTGGQTMNPSTEDILREVERTPAELVIVLPNNKNIIMAAEQCIPLTKKKVVVLPTRTVPQGVAAMLAYDPDSEDGAALIERMGEMAGTVRTAQVTYAARDSDFGGHEIHANEYLGLLDGALLGSCTELQPLLDKLCTELRAMDPVVLTLYYGEDVTEQAAKSAAAFLAEKFPDTEINIINGGQPVYYYVIAAE